MYPMTSLLNAQPTQHDLFGPVRPPVMAAYGAGVDSTAMLIEMVQGGEIIDIVLFADTGAEKPQTYVYLELFADWLRKRGIILIVVRYQPQDFKNFPAYRSLDENCFTNGTLPSISFGFSSCSQKWKIAPQNKWAETWEPAQRIWAAGGKVVKLIGYDCSPADQKRYANREGYKDDRYLYRYPLREWGWTRENCKDRIRQAGLPVPVKSACYMCGATKPHELHDYPPELLRRIVLMEARAKPRLRNVEGLWRNSVKGYRGATPRPGSMTQYIREQGLLPDGEIDIIVAAAPVALVSWQESMAEIPTDERTPLHEWLRLFDMTNGLNLDPDGIPKLYDTTRQALCPV
jgi:hypothetical protein